MLIETQIILIVTHCIILYHEQNTNPKYFFKAPNFHFLAYRDPDYESLTVKLEYVCGRRTRSKKVTFREALQHERDLLKISTSKVEELSIMRLLKRKFKKLFKKVPIDPIL